MFNIKTWIDRVSEFPTRRLLTKVSDGTSEQVIVSRDEGTVTTVGDTFDANTMNNLEARIASAFTADNQKMGDLNDLNTEDKSSLVDAINEVAAGGGGGGSSTLAGLTDTNINAPTNGQVLKYNSTSSKWENANESGGGSSENYLVFVYTNSQGILNHDLISSHYIYQGIVDQDGNTVAVEDVEGLIFTSGYSVYLDLTSTYSYTEHNRLKCECPYMYNGTKMYLGFAYLSELMKMLYTIQIETSSSSQSQYDVDFWLTNAWTTSASSINYDHTSSGLSATKVQGAIDELASEKADLASPDFTGNPTAPTQSKGNNSTRIATTAFVNNEIDNDTKYHVGDSFSVAGTACLFLQTGTSARITIPLCKPVGSDVTAAVNSGNWEIRDCNGSTTNGDKTTSGHPLSYYVTTPSSDLKVNIGTNTINILLSNLKASTWGSTSRYTVGSAYANGGNSITFS